MFCLAFFFSIASYSIGPPLVQQMAIHHSSLCSTTPLETRGDYEGTMMVNNPLIGTSFFGGEPLALRGVCAP